MEKVRQLRKLQLVTEEAIKRGIERHRRQISLLQARLKRLESEDWASEVERKARGA